MTSMKPWVFSTKPVAECNICSNHLFSVCHPHITSLSGVLKNLTDEPLNILLGSSTLHNIWKCPTFKTRFRTDYDCIIGGQIHDCHASFLCQIGQWSGPLNVVLACGVNNIPTGDSALDIIFQFKSLISTIKNLNVKNKVVVAQILFAPKFCDSSLQSNRNMLHKIREVNKWIKEFNHEETGLHLEIGKYGVIGDPMKGRKVQHNYLEWNEKIVARKLHLVPEVKNKIAPDLVSVFRRMQELS